MDLWTYKVLFSSLLIAFKKINIYASMKAFFSWISPSETAYSLPGLGIGDGIFEFLFRPSDLRELLLKHFKLLGRLLLLSCESPCLFFFV